MSNIYTTTYSSAYRTPKTRDLTPRWESSSGINASKSYDAAHSRYCYGLQTERRPRRHETESDLVRRDETHGTSAQNFSKTIGYQPRQDDSQAFAHSDSERITLDSATEEQIRAIIYGHCIGDAIGLLSEFMTREEAYRHYRRRDSLEYRHKVKDGHREIWADGDWTDDADQMILIMQSLTEKRGRVSATDFASKLHNWARKGFPELGDTCGEGIGNTTYKILQDPNFLENPHKAAEEVWRRSGGTIAPNGAVMRTSILGIHEFWDIDRVQENAVKLGKTTHYDPRCQASVIAVCVAIALMLRRQKPYFHVGYSKDGYNVDAIIEKCYECASKVLRKESELYELHGCLWCTSLEDLYLDEPGKIGYTFKCLGAGFWALKQNDFRSAMTQIVMNAGDADTNGAVAGALLGCKLRRVQNLPGSWLSGLLHKSWLERQINSYLKVLKEMFRNNQSGEQKRRPHSATRPVWR